MKILVIGGGGREHALAWRLAQGTRVQKVYVAPGNAGTALEDGVENLPITAIPELLAFAQNEEIHFTVVGPEAPLAAGIVDAFRAAGQKIFGPTKAAAQLESSKDFAKAFMVRHNIPTAFYRDLYRHRGGQRLCGKTRRTHRDQGRWSGCGQGRGGGDEQGRSPRRHRHDAVRQQARRCRRARGDRGISGRRGSQLYRDGGRQKCAGAGHQPGSQTPAGWRPGPQHRRHGRVFPGAGRHARHFMPARCAK